MFNFGIILAVPIVAESAKKYVRQSFPFNSSMKCTVLPTVHRILSLFLNWERVKKFFTIRGVQLGDKIPREFDLPKSILDLIYTQTLLW